MLYFREVVLIWTRSRIYADVRVKCKYHHHFFIIALTGVICSAQQNLSKMSGS